MLKIIDEQITRYFYATNTPFNHVMHEELKKLCSLLQPGYIPPSERRLSRELLDTLHTKVIAESKEILSGETVTMSFDGWSNVYNESLICTSVITTSGDTFLTSTMTPQNSHMQQIIYVLEQNNPSWNVKKNLMSIFAVLLQIMLQMFKK